MKDFYYILGTDANCTTVEIREAYRKLSKKFHPDLNENDHYFEGRFKEIQEAYETLSDPSRRQHYDEQFKKQKHNYYAPTVDEPVRRRGLPRTTAVDVIFTIVLASLTILFGNYVWNAINSPNKPKPLTTATAANTTDAAPVITTLHHKKKKHKLAITDIPEAEAEPKPQKVAQQAVLKNNKDIASATIAPQPKKKPDTVKAPVKVASNSPATSIATTDNTGSDNNALPYSSYLRSNITGVVNMHRLNDISSAIVAVIPANTMVKVLARGNSYYMVQYNNAVGYVPSWTVKTK